MPGRCKSVLNMKFDGEVSEYSVIELSIIVSDDSVGKSESIDDQLLEETFGLALDDVHQWLDFDPLGEVVDGDDKELSLANCCRK